MRKETKAISTLITIFLILVAVIVSSLLTYAWVLAPFYLEPNTIDLVVTDAVFPVDHATSFLVTVMNPSHSTSGTNITGIFLTAEGKNTTSVTGSDPQLPIFMDRGTVQTINCSLDWGGFAGKTVTVHVSTSGDVEAARQITTTYVDFQVDAVFDPTVSVEYFNATVSLGFSTINLTLNRVLFDLNPVEGENLSMALPALIRVEQNVTFSCLVNWEGHTKPLVRVETHEGYAAEIRKDANASVSLQVTQVTFDETDSNRVNITLSNSPASMALLNITRINMTHNNTTEVISGNLSEPSLPQVIDVGQNVTFVCTWNWTGISYRDINVTVTPFNQQGFTPNPLAVQTPPRVAGKINEVIFDLDDTSLFYVNVTNLPYSLQTVNVTRIDINGVQTNITSTPIDPGAESIITCTFNWSGYVGQSVNLVAHAMFDSNESLITYGLNLPYLKVANASFFSMSPGSLYLNVTVRNSEFSKVNATITKINAKLGNATIPIAEAIGYQITVGSELGIVCPWNWSDYVGQDAVIVVQAADGNQVSATFKVG